MKRKRLRERVRLAVHAPRSKEYINLRFYWLHELRQLRAKRRVSGTANKADIKAAQRQLAKLRKEHS